MLTSESSIFAKLAIFSLLWSSAAAAQSHPGVEIRRFLEGLDAGAGAVIAGERLNETAILSDLYRRREHAPIWLPGAPLAAEALSMLAAIDESAGHGLAVERYHRSTIDELLRRGSADSRLALELLLTDAFLSQALHRGRGAVYPPNLDAHWNVPQAEVDAGALLQQAAEEYLAVADVLADLWPTDPEYAQLVRRRAEIVASGDTDTVQVPTGPLLKPGQSSGRVVALKERLMGPGDYTPVYDDELRAEVTAFQLAAGLEPDGIVGENTLEVLNATSVSWIDRIDANLERWRWLPRETPGTYIRVNIAAYTLQIVENGAPMMSMNVIVGLPYRRTPVFTETVKYLVLNPYWNVPYSIATKDKLPLLKADAAAESAKGFEVKPAGQDAFIPVDEMNWEEVTARNFGHLLRQRPGPANALGRIKFMLPNPYSVYLHDTPNRELFARQERSFSSGCIRVERPLDLAEWLLHRENNANADKVEELLQSGNTQTIYLKEPVPTYIVYFTAFSVDGDVLFRRDIYDRDRVLVEALRAP